MSREKEFIQLITESQGIIHKVCGIYCDEEEARKDLFQEILIQLWKSFDSFKGESKFSTWMYRVSLNIALQQLRKANSQPLKIPLILMKQDLPEPPSDFSYEANQQLLHQAIKSLNDVEKAIIMLHLEEKDNSEIADIIGITQNYVRVKMTRIRTKLKEVINSQ